MSFHVPFFSEKKRTSDSATAPPQVGNVLYPPSPYPQKGVQNPKKPSNSSLGVGQPPWFPHSAWRSPLGALGPGREDVQELEVPQLLPDVPQSLKALETKIETQPLQPFFFEGGGLFCVELGVVCFVWGALGLFCVELGVVCFVWGALGLFCVELGVVCFVWGALGLFCVELGVVCFVWGALGLFCVELGVVCFVWGALGLFCVELGVVCFVWGAWGCFV